MFYHLFYPLSSDYSIFNVFRYITFRSAYAGITALVLCLVFGPMVIRALQKLEVGETIRTDGPQSHISKSGTPTMGGLLVIFTFLLATLLWANLTNTYVWLLIFVAVGFGLIGFVDDFLKLRKGKGLTARSKLFWQILVATMVGLFCTYFDPHRMGFATNLYVPFFKDFTPDLGGWYVVLIVIVIVGTSNAVNLTDGLDGLAIGPIIIATLTYTALVYITGHFKFAGYLNIQYVGGAGEIAVLTSAIVGASLGFLWFNAYPAQMFMGDVGSLSLGAILGTVAVIAKQELLLILVGGIFVIEALSVIIQVAYFKYTGGKRFFKMAPLHHHFEHLGWEEPKVIVRFWIIAVVLAMLSLSTLKLR
ncbi:Phospho-N-acetylmuramoyl-pentapeptide transferase [Nitrospina gracilis 3/211]|uniref:Phospho-N-acetylmuramoyl-pentapeptide-transferase n=1 Tax=Nitrospina gracilis (strain 3/211) TaxID=1266370 RepID=M1Z8L0_NITG3|nr:MULTISPECIES: phospho-N-acetylmuramoyl-pentapeptide-transferase [Nitrospina]MCF8722182.1 phospho-N-acetylmuramoyl-pentapeptide-transferase [Nitrospina sp. Nb-3]CCQ89375.1 Phospho-N-acetylmuramoyl-pentapeptide transferase [Nitrospina gracilis 3/211]